MTEVTKRLRYFDGQVLGAQDFTDEQYYILDRQHRYSRFLNAAGIVDGLEVSQGTAPGQIEVHPGTALDAQGRQIVLSDTRTVSLADCKGQTVEVVIVYSQEEADPQMTAVWPEGPRVVEGTEPNTLVAVPPQVQLGDHTRFHEKPYVGLNTALPPGIMEPLTLAAVTLDANGVVTQVDETPRVYAGIRLPAGKSKPGGVILRAYTHPGNLDQTAWHDVTYVNDWHQCSPEIPVQYWKDSQGMVHFRGQIQGGLYNNPQQVAFRLPEGYRPSSTHRYPVGASDTMPTSVVVQPNGEVEILMNFGVMVSLDGITFQAVDSSGGPVWRNVNFAGSWGPDPGDPVQYWQDNRGIVYVRGTLAYFRRQFEVDPISPGSVASVGIGYRPTHRQIHKAVTSDKQDGFARVDVLPNGSVELVSGIAADDTRVSLTGIAFHTQEPSAWRDVECHNNWQRFDTTHNPIQYWKDSEGIVYLRGLMRGGTIGAENADGLAFTLPIGYRPAYPQVHTVCTSPGRRGRVDVLPNGHVVVVSASNDWVSLDDMTFRAEGSPAESAEDVLPRIVSGIVTDTGTTQATVGFTVTRVSTGLYDITFTPAFAAPPAASVTQIWAEAEQPGGSTLNNTILVSLEQAKMRVKTGNSAGEAADRSFSFIAIGPR